MASTKLALVAAAFAAALAADSAAAAQWPLPELSTEGLEAMADEHGQVALGFADTGARPASQSYAATVGTGWAGLGPFGADVSDVASSPTNPSIVLATVAPSTGFGGTLYRSTDGAVSWSEVSSMTGINSYDIEFDPNGKAWVGTIDSVFSSTDDGATWTQHLLGIGPNDQTFEIAIDPGNPNTIWVGVAGALGGQTKNVLRSTNGGISWANRTPAGAAGMSCTGISVDPTDSTRIFACFGPAFGGGAAYRSFNGGSSWTSITAGLPVVPMQDIVHDGTRLWVAGGLLFGSQFMGLYSSVNDGSSWTAVHDVTWPNLVINDIEIDPANPSVLYLASAGSGVYRSGDGGANWSFGIGGTGSLSVNAVSVAPAGATAVYMGSASAAVWKSGDGVNFGPASVGIASLNLESIAANPNDSSEIAAAFSGLNNGGVYSSLDGGLSWTLEALPGMRFNTVAFAPDGTLHAVSDGPTTIGAEGLWRRTGGGWVSLGPDQGPQFESELYPVLFDAGAPGVILIAGSDFGVAGHEPTVWLSIDDGATWLKAYEGATQSEEVFDLERSTDGMVLLAAFSDFSGTQTGGALRSTDGGLNWNPAGVGLPAGAQGRSLDVDPTQPQTFLYADNDFGGGNGGVFRTTDGGLNWASTGFVGSVLQVEYDPLDTTRIFTAHASGTLVRVSTDAGATFSPYTTGLAPASGRALAFTGEGVCRRLLLATSIGSFGQIASCMLESDTPSISLATGGAQTFTLRAGEQLGTQFYWILGSTSGTSPGTAAGPFTLPLVFDTWFAFSLTHANQPPYAASFGILSAAGKGAAGFVLPAGLSPGLVGLTFDHAYAVFEVGGGTASVTAVSNSCPLVLLP